MPRGPPGTIAKGGKLGKPKALTYRLWHTHRAARDPGSCPAVPRRCQDTEGPGLESVCQFWVGVLHRETAHGWRLSSARRLGVVPPGTRAVPAPQAQAVVGHAGERSGEQKGGWPRCGVGAEPRQTAPFFIGSVFHNWCLSPS